MSSCQSEFQKVLSGWVGVAKEGLENRCKSSLDKGDSFGISGKIQPNALLSRVPLKCGHLYTPRKLQDRVNLW